MRFIFHCFLVFHFSEALNINGLGTEKSCGFQCGSGECISYSFFCDGLPNCLDGSDEKSCRAKRFLGFPNSNPLGTIIPSPLQPQEAQSQISKGIGGVFTNPSKLVLNNPFGSTSTTKKNISDQMITTTTIAPKKEKQGCFSGKGIWNPITGTICTIGDYIECRTKSLLGVCLDKVLYGKDRSCGNKFQCSNGECITINHVCDGQAQCGDASDESKDVCELIDCSENLFRCHYGACLKLSAQCDGSKDCLDGSDEVNCDSFIRTNSSSKDMSGQQEKNRTCPDILGNESRLVSCKLNEEDIGCRSPVEGTVLKYVCTPFHSDEEGYQTGELYCFDGSWNRSVPECQPDCGRRGTFDPHQLSSRNPRSLRDDLLGERIINGNEVDRTTVLPWNVAIYMKYQEMFHHICGGTIISTKLVVSAAHCFEKENDILNDPSMYSIGAGKLYRNYSDERDNSFSQFKDVAKIVVPDNFKGEVYYYLADIAVLILKDPLEWSLSVRPVCVDFSGDFILQPHDNGTITGWGFTKEDGDPAEVLQELPMPYEDESTCLSLLPADFAKNNFNKNDKICAGYFNQSRAVCKGDSGSGLVFPDEKNRYYLQGIVSTAPKNKMHSGCDKEQYTLFTRVSNYRSWLNELFNNNK